ncbi:MULTISPECIES: hypothetical protein [unclassified Brevundimonas]|uniref:hypothetical protein n=1 Tax=unclassified Brevundimonas TaxID=2622653 RepID=UPI000CFBB393|nr:MULTISPECIES: hypothetical protein [unclassified Brevundimonas]PRA27412.1 hypothetical protein CQ024_11440 [Brevundimonas sp. MYb27]PQZ84543.1 hypothetical protein CQ026_01740 [Brevundimonas sp. MYb31]PRB17778.1 hypothetical protein CQ039_01740 [Brevundimonas sp. MYb52]PRB38149.1 hypothetical protein CQ035_01740 [Brevundimonas sp. MYb46]PRB56069.1 hypothetical protein CQ028_01190 [Brevundimonas sp. MYb33]
MIPDRDIEGEAPSTDGDEDLLTRAEASAFLALLGVRLKPATLARLWSTASNGPPCRHIRSRPYYPRGLLRVWAKAQITEVRTGAPPAARSRGRA